MINESLQIQIKSLVAKAFELPYFRDIAIASDFYLESARQKYLEFLSFEPQVEDTGQFFANLYKKFINLPGESNTDYFSLLDPEENRFLELTLQFIAYLDRNALENTAYNVYPDKRTLLNSNITPAEWITGLLFYRKEINRIRALPGEADSRGSGSWKVKDDRIPSIPPALVHILAYLRNPGGEIPVFSEKHRTMIAENILAVPYNPQSFRDSFTAFCREYTFPVTNQENYHLLFVKILYLPELYAIWNPADNQTNGGAEKTGTGDFDILLTAEDLTPVTYLSAYHADNEAGEDTLGISREVHAFASLILARQLIPPLSIGLFGNWGSGKSFFMRSLEDRIHALTHNDYQADRSFCTQVVNIRFNAWHYMDTNLWASLMSHILEKLDAYFKDKQDQKALYKDLEITRQVLEKRDAEKQSIETQKVNIKTEWDALTGKKEDINTQLKNLSLIDIVDGINKDAEINTLLTSAAQHLGIGKIDWEAVSTFLQNARSAFTKIKYFLHILFSLKGFKSRALILLFAIPVLLALCAFILPPVLAWFKIEYTTVLAAVSRLAAIIAPFLVFCGKSIAKIKPVFTQINQGIRLLTRANTRIEDSRAIGKVKIENRIIALRQEYTQITEKEKAAAEEYRKTELKLSRLETELGLISSRQLIRFIQDRLSDRVYAQHLGIISLIRKDLETLSLYLAGSGEEADPETHRKKRIERIVLYIDDLDRCPPERVVEVLQAVHLILAFKLFVVVLGVDIRWISRSLAKQYGSLLAATKETQADYGYAAGKTDTSPFDYLEKIFQIPFSIKKIDDQAKAAYIRSLLAGDMEEEEKPGETTGRQEPADTPGADNKNAVSGALQLPEKTVQVPETGLTIRPVKITRVEMEFCLILRPLLGHSPRSIKRMINLYRLIKTNPDWFTYDLYQDTLFFLALVTGIPYAAQSIFTYLENQKQLSQNILLTAKNTVTPDNPYYTQIINEFEILADFLKHNVNLPDEKPLTAQIKQLMQTITRFSFRLGVV